MQKNFIKELEERGKNNITISKDKIDSLILKLISMFQSMRT